MEKKSKTDRNQNIAVDRISELPESIIHEQIMPRLSRRYRSRTSVLSKTWYNLNKTFPALDFDFISFRTSLQKEKLLSSRPELDKEEVKSFKIRTDESFSCFSRKKISLHSLRVYFYPGSVSDINSWVELGLENKVEKLKLYNSNHLSLYRLPEQVYSSTSITTLKLERCVLDQPLSLFSSVKKLVLLNCLIKKGSIVLKHPDCPALEALTIQSCCGLRSIHISNLVRLHTVVLELSRLKIVNIVSPSVVRIELSRLTIVDIASPIVQRVSFQGYKRKIWSNVDNNGCYCLKVLHLRCRRIEDREFNGLLSKLPLLEDLYVVECDSLREMQVSNPRLKTLLVAPFSDSRLKSIEIAAPSLKSLMFFTDTRMTEPTKIKVHDSCGGLETLVLYNAIMKDKRFHKLIAKLPQLRNLWIFRCHGFKRIEIPNVRLRRLHIARCLELTDVEVGSRELFEMHCWGRKDLKVSVPDADRMNGTGGLKCKRVDDCGGKFWSVSLEEMLMSLLKDKSLADIMCDTSCTL